MKVIAAFTVAAACLFAAVPASADEARVAVGDLNFASVAGADSLDARINAATRDLCRHARRPGSRISDRAFCTAAVRAEVMRQLPARARYDCALARLPRVEIQAAKSPGGSLRRGLCLAWVDQETGKPRTLSSAVTSGSRPRNWR